MKPCMGCTGSAHGRLNFKDCIVPVTNILGEEGKGLGPALHLLNISRVRIAASAMGTMERCLDLAIEFAKKRVTFGKAIAERQAIQRYISEMAMDIYALQCAINDVAVKIDEGKDILLEGNLCKLLAMEGGRRVTDNALLIFGGIGYTREYPIERLYRDIRLNWLEEATPTIQYLVSARQVLDGKRTYQRFHDEVVESSLEKQIRL
jgi:alkylation response protein AidB-like acyl-CoA dehydrogenase